MSQAHDPRVGAESQQPDEVEEPKEALVDEEVEEPHRSKAPLIVMATSLGALLLTLGIIGFLFTRNTTPEAQPTSTPEPTGVPQLPISSGAYARDPAPLEAPSAFAPNDRTQIVSATYKKDGQSALVAVAGRPVTETKTLLDQIQAKAIRDMGNGTLCGRDDRDQDVCAAHKGRTAVLVEGMRGQPAQELADAAVQLLNGTR